MNQLIGLSAAVIAALSLTACSGASASSAVDAGMARAPQATAAYDESVPDSDAASASGVEAKKLARSATASLEVTDVQKAASAVSTIAETVGGQVSGEQLVLSEDASLPSTVVISVPSDKLESALQQLNSVGKIIDRSVTSEDVSTVVADVDSRVKTLTASIDRLRVLAKKAGSVAELTALEAQITERTATRDSLLAQQRVLADRVAEADITVSLYTQTPPTPEPEPVGFLSGLAAGWSALVVTTQVALQVLGALLPFAAVIVVIGVPAFLLRRAWRRNKGVARADSNSSETLPPTGPDHQSEQE